MGSDRGSPDRVSRVRRHRDDDDDDHLPRGNDRDCYKRKPDEHNDSKRRRERSRSRSRDSRRKDRRRSRTPDSPRRRRSRSRDGGRDRDRDRGRGRDQDRRRNRDSDRDRHTRRRSPQGKELTSRRRRHGDDDVPDAERPPSRRRSPLRRGGPLPSQSDSFAVVTGDLDEPPKPKEKPNFGTSGVLAAVSNAVQQADGSTITLKYHEPPEARKPPSKDDWRLFVFKGEDALDTIPLSARSCWLVGREVAIVDMPAEHPSISKQHAVIQFRYIEKRNEFGDRVGRVKPYLIDLESANGTFLNGNKVAESRYIELRDKDVIKFGHSTREYVLMLAPKG